MERTFLAILLIMVTNISFGQKKQKIEIPFVSDIKMDGNLDEWEALVDVAEEGLWSYQVAQDAANLYFAVRVIDPSLQHTAAGQGILFSVLANRKNRDDIHFLFPYVDSEVMRAMKQEVHASPEVFRSAFIERSRGYFVRGFPTVPNGLLSFQNTYGLHASVRLDEGGLYYEAVIPKVLLDYTEPVATLGIGIHDGVTAFVPSNKKPAARTRGGYGAYRGRSASAPKDTRTLTVHIETTIN